MIMSQQVFTSMSDAKITSLIEGATRRVAVVTPAIHTATTNALVGAAGRLGKDSISIIMDCDEEVFRLGYGSIDTLRKAFPQVNWDKPFDEFNAARKRDDNSQQSSSGGDKS